MPQQAPNRNFGLALAVCHVAVLIFYFVHTEYAYTPGYMQRYNYLVGITIMMFVGFGYLMTFLRWNGLGAVGLTMVITCLGLELDMILEPLFKEGSWDSKVKIDLLALMNGDFAVAAVLISFGGVIGKVSPLELLVMVVVETIVYCALKILILERWLTVVDAGGTIGIHMFGAYYGLAVSAVLGKPQKKEKARSSVNSDLMSLIGTVFLWLYWPSFNGGVLDIGSSEAELAFNNTILALVGATISTFIISPLVSHGKIRPVDVQNATLAGGVAVGAVAHLDIHPAGALMVGTLGGAISSLGYYKVQVWLEKLVHDTCGIHNLHGMPSIFGEPGKQLACMGFTLLVAIIAGLLTGALLLPLHNRGLEMADDNAFWEVAEDQLDSQAPSALPSPRQQKYHINPPQSHSNRVSPIDNPQVTEVDVEGGQK